MNKKKIFLLIFGCVVLFISCYFLTSNVVTTKLRGDSGFDTSYDSGGSSWDSGSSWSSSSGNSSSGSYSGSDGQGGDEFFDFIRDYPVFSRIYIFGFIVSLIYILFMFYKKNKKNSGPGFILIFMFIIIVFYTLSGVIFPLVFALIFNFLNPELADKITRFIMKNMIKILAILILILLLLILYSIINYNIISIILSCIIFVTITVLIQMHVDEKKEKARKFKPKSKVISLSRHKGLNNANINIPNFDKDKFIEDRYNDYIKIQNAWMNFDYDTLKEKLTDELYNQYVMQLDTLKIKNEKNVMSDFVYVDSMITKISEVNGVLQVTTEMIVEFIDYICDENGKILRGSKYAKVTQHYEMVFVMDKNSISKCPNCGTDISEFDNICPSCHSNIPLRNNVWKLSKKESIEQTIE